MIESQVRNVERMVQLENLTTITVIIFQASLFINAKIKGWKLWLTGSLHSFKGSIHKIYKYKGKNNFTVEKLDRHHFN